MTIKSKLKITGFFLLVLVAITLLILPGDFFDKGESICLSVLLLDMECYACGMTRAIQHLIHFEFEQAYDFNKLSIIVFPLLVYVLINEFIKTLKEIKEEKTKVD